MADWLPERTAGMGAGIGVWHLSDAPCPVTPVASRGVLPVSAMVDAGSASATALSSSAESVGPLATDALAPGDVRSAGNRCRRRVNSDPVALLRFYASGYPRSIPPGRAVPMTMTVQRSC